MGKGNGKGGCGCCTAIGEAVQCAACALCCCLITGPVMMIVGLMFLLSALNDGRGQRIDEFNAAVDAWQGGPMGDFSDSSGWTYQVSNDCLQPTLVSQELSPSDAAEILGAESAESDVFGAYNRVKFSDDNPEISVSVSRTDPTCNIAITIRNSEHLSPSLDIATVSTEAMNVQYKTFGEMGCSAQERKEKIGGTDNYRTYYDEDADVSSCRNNCESRGGSSTGYTYDSFQCTIIDRPKAICVRVKKDSNGAWISATGTLPERPSGATGAGCFLERNGDWQEVQRETITSSEVQLRLPVQVRHERDPYLYFLDISDGSLDFGLTTKEKLVIGSVVMAIGFIITSIVCTACFCICKFAWMFAKGGDQAHRPQNAVGGALYDVSAKYGSYVPGGATAVGVPAQNAVAPIAQVQKPPQYGGATPGYSNQGYGGPVAQDTQPGYGAPTYGSPQLAYGPHQPAYGPPQPAYGPPQPAYGPPQPAYGPPQPAYGPPAPAAAPAGYPPSMV